VKITFLKPAEKELDDAVEYYESEQWGLGIRFQKEVALPFPVSLGSRCHTKKSANILEDVWFINFHMA